jgi:predicted nucleic acid-binding protein
MGYALIAATALEHQLPLLTANVKHFGAVKGLKVEAFEP